MLLASPALAKAPPSPPAATADLTTEAPATFKALFQSWRRLDNPAQSAIAIPAVHPVTYELRFSSPFGMRTDPFTGQLSFHPGVDIPGPVGTPIYATANGVVEIARPDGGYGNLVEIDHGHGIETRYGHLSKILVSANEQVTRGQLIGLMGSTGRSTGSHLHYEVRIDGRPVNPVPFLQSADFLKAVPESPQPLLTAATTVPGASQDPD